MRIPNQWGQVTIKKFLAYRTALQTKDIDAVEQNIKILSALSGEEEKVFEQMPIDELKVCISKLSFLEGLDGLKFMKPQFYLGGKTYDVIFQLNKMSALQYVKFKEYCKQNPEDVLVNMHKILACFCVPRKNWFMKQKFDGNDIEKTYELFYKELTIDIAYPLCLFFCEVWSKLMVTMPTFLNQELSRIRKKLDREVKVLANTGAGSQP